MLRGFCKKIMWQCYVITMAMSTVVYFFAHGLRLNGPWGYLFGYGMGAIFLYGLAFGMAIILGIRKAHLKWLYPILSAMFAWIVPPTLFLLIINHEAVFVDIYYYNYLFFGFIEVFAIQLIAAWVGLLIGRKCTK